MRLYFLRHAEARSSGPVNEQDRELRPKGVRRAGSAAHAMKKLGLAPARLYSSPIARARQTAEIVAKELEVEVDVREEMSIERFNIEVLKSLITDLNNDDEVVLVGHEPGFSTVISALTGGRVEIKRGGLVRVDIYSASDPLEGVLVWIIAPRVLGSIGE